MAYVEIEIQVLGEWKDIVLAELDNLGFEGVWDMGNELYGYITADIFNQKQLYDTLAKYGMENNFSHHTLGDQNWNENWEKNYDPVHIDDRVYIRSPFHEENKNALHEIVIQPQMSFGTGHHDTTRLMIEMMLTMNFKDLGVLDMGTGTGVLSIMASILGAREVVGVDNDANCVDNAKENLKYNAVHNVTYRQGSHEAIPQRSFNIVLSNITKNNNLKLLPHLVERVSDEGYLAMAGFLYFDLEEVNGAVMKHSFKLVRSNSSGDWECLLYQKI